MKTIQKALHFIVYIIFFAATWIINFIICDLVFSHIYNSSDGILQVISILSILFLPIMASTLETVAFSKKWAEKQSSKGIYPPPQKDPPIEPVIATCHFDIQPQTTYSPLHHSDTVETMLYAIDCMEGHEFEYWCADALRKMGYRYVEVTPGSSDHGVDVLAQKDGVKYAVQCKRYSSDLGNKPVQEVHAGKAIYHCHVGIVITNQHFTTGAKQLAAATDTLLWDREWIRCYLASQNQNATSPCSVASTVEFIEDDEMLPMAIDVVLQTGQASVSMLQRHLRLGYARCSRMMDQMEAKGIVGPFQGVQPRSILITKKQWQSMRKNYYQ